MEHIIQTIDNKKMIEKAISKVWDLTKFLTEANQTEDIARQMKDMGTENVSLVHSDLPYPKQQSSEFTKNTAAWEKHKCQYCGLLGVHEKGKWSKSLQNSASVKRTKPMKDLYLIAGIKKKTKASINT